MALSQQEEVVGYRGRAERAMTLAVPADSSEIRRIRQFRLRRKLYREKAELQLEEEQAEQKGLFMSNGLATSPLRRRLCRTSPLPPRRMTLADAFADSIRTLTFPVRRNSSPRQSQTNKQQTKRMKRSRLVLKNGICNVYGTNMQKKDRQYLRDIFTTLIDVKWRYVIASFAVVFAISWTGFASAYYCVSFLHGDFSVGVNSSSPLAPARQPCVTNIDGFWSAMLFAVETQHTIGYGFRHPTSACYVSGLLVFLQSICGLLIQSIMVGLVFAKLTRPKKRAETLIFSEKAVITLRDGQLCFLFRVGDMRNTHLVEAHLRMQFITARQSKEGEVEPLHQHEMRVGGESGDDRLFLVWPTTICHVIDVKSPLFAFSARTLPLAHFEIIVILEGIVESTGMTAQARTSYLPCEILWGHRFEKLVTYQRSNGTYKVDYNLFQKTYEVNTPQCSAKEFYKKNIRFGEGELYFCKREAEQNPLDGSRSSVDFTPLPSPSFVHSPPPSPPIRKNSSIPSSLGSSGETAVSKLMRPAAEVRATDSAAPLIIVESPSPRTSVDSSPSAHPQADNPSQLSCQPASVCSVSTSPSTLSDLEEEATDIDNYFHFGNASNV